MKNYGKSLLKAVTSEVSILIRKECGSTIIMQWRKISSKKGCLGRKTVRKVFYVAEACQQ